jgi:hypothetical protein
VGAGREVLDRHTLLVSWDGSGLTEFGDIR